MRAALLTRHGKERVIAPLVREVLGVDLEVDRDFDTDTLGTFTREVPRLGSQRDAARRKAQLAVERTGAEIGIGSEGAFVPGPFGFGSWDVEIVVWVDVARGIEVAGHARVPGRHHHATVTSVEALLREAAQADFPRHGLVLRPDAVDDPRCVKGLTDVASLKSAFDEAMACSALGRVVVESDLRAHLHPERMAAIGQAARDLFDRVARACPRCASPGFGVAEVHPGLPCESCGLPTEEALADILACVACDHRERRLRDRPFASAASCALCNP